MKNVFIIPSLNGHTADSFAPFIRELCLRKNIDFYFPAFPTGEAANYRTWAEVMDNYSGGILNNDSLVIAHSAGAHFLPKYLKEKNLKINTYVSVAGSTRFIDKVVQDKTKDFLSDKDDLGYMKNNALRAFAFYSDNDMICTKDGLEEYARLVGAKEIILKGYGHFGPKSGVSRVPELEQIVKDYIDE